MRIGEYIRQKRLASGLSLRETATMAGVSPAYLSRVEAGKVPPSEALLKSVGRAVGEDPERLILVSGSLPTAWQRRLARAPAEAALILKEAFEAAVSRGEGARGEGGRVFRGTRLIEAARFPFEMVSDIAELESWRKELHRPIYHMHKWWAQRLGSVFRALILAAFAPQEADLMRLFYEAVRLPGVTVFDPFMGSGTTVGEALKLGACAIGRDINPVADFAVRNALAPHNRKRILEAFKALEVRVATRLRCWYRARLATGVLTDVLYFFWVKTVPCPQCGSAVDLFSKYVFTRHAMPSRNGRPKAVCPLCGEINEVHSDARAVTCGECGKAFDPQKGPAQGSSARCSRCEAVFPIAKTFRDLRRPPGHRLFAKLVLLPEGSKAYLPADEYDHALYARAERALATLGTLFPVVPIRPGYNTKQVLNYGYTHWHQMFNARQLLCLGLLGREIAAIEDRDVRELFVCLFSGALEFNNMFASYKGEGTGAVRHMFSHHILKPERTPLEANVWGTPYSSGSFSTLFRSRLLRAVDYAENPYELKPVYGAGRPTGKKVFALSCPIGHEIASTFRQMRGSRTVYLSCGDSARTDLPSGSVDAVITDPPFFDNVHYSELADFFYVWQRHLLRRGGRHKADTTRSESEVQSGNAGTFARRLTAVFKECGRVLTAEGVLIFTYHHSRDEGWFAVADAVRGAGCAITAAHPIKSEMSVAAPKSQAKEPIDLDIVFVCRKRDLVHLPAPADSGILAAALEVAQAQVRRMNANSRSIGRADARVILWAQVLAQTSRLEDASRAMQVLHCSAPLIEEESRQLYSGQKCSPPRRRAEPALPLFETTAGR